MPSASLPEDTAASSSLRFFWNILSIVDVYASKKRAAQHLLPTAITNKMNESPGDDADVNIGMESPMASTKISPQQMARWRHQRQQYAS